MNWLRNFFAGAAHYVGRALAAIPTVVTTVYHAIDLAVTTAIDAAGNAAGFPRQPGEGNIAYGGRAAGLVLRVYAATVAAFTVATLISFSLMLLSGAAGAVGVPGATAATLLLSGVTTILLLALTVVTLPLGWVLFRKRAGGGVDYHRALGARLIGATLVTAPATLLVMQVAGYRLWIAFAGFVLLVGLITEVILGEKLGWVTTAAKWVIGIAAAIAVGQIVYGEAAKRFQLPSSPYEVGWLVLAGLAIALVLAVKFKQRAIGLLVVPLMLLDGCFLIGTGAAQWEAVKRVRAQAAYDAAPPDEIVWVLDLTRCRGEAVTACEEGEEDMGRIKAQVLGYRAEGILDVALLAASGTTTLGVIRTEWRNGAFRGPYRNVTDEEEGSIVLRPLGPHPRSGFSGRWWAEGKHGIATLASL